MKCSVSRRVSMQGAFLLNGLLLLLAGCGHGQSGDSPDGYDLSSPEKIIMRDNLLEISGITFLPDAGDSVLAINDEEGRIFSVSLSTGNAVAHSFSNAGDFEDITVFGNSVVVLQSNGNLFACPGKLNHGMAIREWKTGLPKGDYESLFADNTEGKLYILCKSGKQAKGNTVLGYIFRMATDASLSAPEPFTITIDHPGIQLPKGGLMPSALTKNPQTNEWYMLSSANKMLLVLDGAWKVTSVYKLKPGLFLQPEGIAFDQKGNLYISNEGDKLTNGNILKFAKRTK